MNKTELAVAAAIGVLVGGLFYLRHSGGGILAGIGSGTSDEKLLALLADADATLAIGTRSKTSQCNVRGPLPDPDCTPGAFFPNATPATICVPGYTKTVRSVSAATKALIYAEYGIEYPQPSGAYEADHLIPLELGGNNEVANLFPEAAEPAPGFREKDLVENYLHNEACAGRIDLAAAQKQIANDWLAVYETLTSEQVDALRRQAAAF